MLKILEKETRRVKEVNWFTTKKVQRNSLSSKTLVQRIFNPLHFHQIILNRVISNGFTLHSFFKLA